MGLVEGSSHVGVDDGVDVGAALGTDDGSRVGEGLGAGDGAGDGAGSGTTVLGEGVGPTHASQVLGHSARHSPSSSSQDFVAATSGSSQIFSSSHTVGVEVGRTLGQEDGLAVVGRSVDAPAQTQQVFGQ